MNLFALRDKLSRDICKMAENKLSAMLKTIPMAGGPGSGPFVPKPGKSLSTFKPNKVGPQAPSSMSGLDLMAPNVSSGQVQTPGAAYSDGLKAGVTNS